MIDITRAQAIEGFMTNGDLEWLAWSARDKHVIVELGCYKGRSTRAMADHCPGRVWAVDDFLTGGDSGAEAKACFAEEFAANLRDLIPDKVIPVALDHAHAARLSVVPYMVFIDGDHSHAAARRDICAWKFKLAPGGLLCGHDFGNGYPGVDMAVEELLPGFMLPQRRQGESGSIWYWRKPC